MPSDSTCAVAPSACCLSGSRLEKIAKAYDEQPWWLNTREFLIRTFACRSTVAEQVRLFTRNLGEVHRCGAGQERVLP